MPSAHNIMLAVHCKRTDALDVKSPILTYVRNTYGDADAEDAADDLEAIQGLRAELVTAQGSSQGAKRETLIKWAERRASGFQKVQGPRLQLRAHTSLAGACVLLHDVADGCRANTAVDTS
jgi:hypothetical protein